MVQELRKEVVWKESLQSITVDDVTKFYIYYFFIYDIYNPT